MKNLIIIGLSWLSFCAHAELPATVVDALKIAGIPQQSVALYVYALDGVQAVEGKSPVLSHNADKSMNPASAMKLVTTNAALDVLTPTYRWKTEVYRDGNLINSVLQGNLVIKGYATRALRHKSFGVC